MEQLSRTRQEEETRTAETRLRRDPLIEEIGRLDRRLSEVNDALERAQANRGAVAEVEAASRNLEKVRQESAGLDARMAAVQAEVTALNAQRDGLVGITRPTEDPVQELDKAGLRRLTNVPNFLFPAKR